MYKNNNVIDDEITHQVLSDKIDHLISANFAKMKRFNTWEVNTWEVSDKPSITIGDVTIVEAVYCSPNM